MNHEEVLKLIDAGFSADEIRQMAEEKPADETPEAKTEEAAAPEVKAPEVSTDIQNLSEQIAKLNDTVVKLQEANIKNARTGSSKLGDPVQEQIESFIKEL